MVYDGWSLYFSINFHVSFHNKKVWKEKKKEKKPGSLQLTVLSSFICGRVLFVQESSQSSSHYTCIPDSWMGKDFEK